MQIDNELLHPWWHRGDEKSANSDSPGGAEMFSPIFIFVVFKIPKRLTSPSNNIAFVVLWVCISGIGPPSRPSRHDN